MMIRNFFKFFCISLPLQIVAVDFSGAGGLESSQSARKNGILQAKKPLLSKAPYKYASPLGLTWIDGQVSVNDDGNIGYGLTGFFTAKETENSIIFSQTSLFKQDSVSTVNVGIGYRKRLFSPFQDPLLFGINGFMDFRSGRHGVLKLASNGVHKRYAVGVELKTSNIDLYANVYGAKKNIIDNYQALGGYDFGISGRLPALENILIGVTAYNFSGKSQYVRGSRVKAEYKPSSLLTFGVEYDKSNTAEIAKMKLYMNTTVRLGVPWEEQVKEVAYTRSHVWDKRYSKVERTNKVYVEKAIQKALLKATNPAPVPWGTSVPSPVTNNPDGAEPLEYTILENTAEAKIDAVSGLVSESKKVGIVKVKASRKKNHKYATDSVTYTVTFKEKEHSLVASSPAPVAWGTPVPAPAIANPDEAEPLKYAITANTAEANIHPTSGLVSGSKKAGMVAVKVSREKNHKYVPSDTTYTVTFKEKEHSLVATDPTPVPWGTSVSAPTISNPDEAEPLEYTMISNMAEAKFDKQSGLVSEAKQSGIVEVKVSRNANSKYVAASTTYKIQFLRKVSPENQAYIQREAIFGNSVEGAPAPVDLIFKYTIKGGPYTSILCGEKNRLLKCTPRNGVLEFAVRTVTDKNSKIQYKPVYIVFPQTPKYYGKELEKR